MGASEFQQDAGKDPVPANGALAVTRPLVVDLDGSLIRTDLLLESFFQLLATHPLKAFRAVFALKHGKAALKSSLADETLLEISTLPFNEEVLAFITAEKEKGRPIYLASASDQRYATSIAAHLGLFDGTLGSENGINLAGPAKAERLCALFGEQGFDYIGDAPVDELVWSKAAGVYI